METLFRERWTVETLFRESWWLNAITVLYATGVVNEFGFRRTNTAGISFSTSIMHILFEYYYTMILQLYLGCSDTTPWNSLWSYEKSSHLFIEKK